MGWRPEIEKLKRPAWAPVTADGDGELTGSKFSGVPALPPGESWPACGNCKKPMQLFLQLNLATLPPELGPRFGAGLLQLFYCTSKKPLCEDICSAYFAWSKAVLARRIDVPPAPSPQAPPAGHFPAKRIASWKRVDDLPGYDEFKLHGVNLTEPEAIDLDKAHLPASGEKLAGWPFWIQSVEYPACRTCKKTMQHVFQIDSNGALPFMFGDAGIGHLTQCPDHKDVLAFGWACG